MLGGLALFIRFQEIVTYRLYDKDFGLRYRSWAYYNNTASSLWPCQNLYLKNNRIMNEEEP